LELLLVLVGGGGGGGGGDVVNQAVHDRGRDAMPSLQLA